MTDAAQTNANPKIAQARADFLASLNRCFSSADGVAVLAWLHATAATRKPAFLATAGAHPIDAYAAASRDGRKSIVWEIEANLEQARASESGADKPKTSGRNGARRQGG